MPRHHFAVAAAVLLYLTSIAFIRAADAPKEAPFEKEIRAFEEADAKSPPEKGGVLFVGSSSIRLWTTLAEDFPELKTINRGFGGSRIAHSTRYADRIVIPYEPRTIVFYAGDNDIAGRNSPEQVLADFKAFVERVHGKLPDTRILFISIKPSIKRWNLVDKMREANRLVKDYTQTSEKLGFIDIFDASLGTDGTPRKELLRDDGLHLTPAGYEVWRDAVKPHLTAN